MSRTAYAMSSPLERERSRRARPLVVAAALTCVSELVGGQYFGFGAPLQHAFFWVLGTLLVMPAIVVVDRLFSPPDFVDIFVRVAVLSFAGVVLGGLVLGSMHLLSLTSFLIGEALLLLWALVIVPRDAQSRGGRDSDARGAAALVGVCVAIVAFVVGMGISHSPFTAYDSLSYHLFFPARWLQDHRLSIIPTPFSDEAQAYQPANGELWFLWLMLPFHGDFLARIGQVPFYLLGGASVYALARRMGCAPQHAIYAPTFLFIAPPVVEQAVGANVDLIHAALFAASLYLGVVGLDTNRRRDWALWGVSVGLFAGTKYLALVYLPVLVAIGFVSGLRMRAAWALPGIATLALPWYLRNWVVAGSPIYPATFTVAGLTIGQGAYTRQAMAASFLHTNEPRLLLVSLVHAFGPTLFLLLLVAAPFILFAILRRQPLWPAGFVMVACLVMPFLCWFTVGDNADSRFLLPAVITSISLTPLAFAAHRRLNVVVHGMYVIGVVWILLGVSAQLHASLPWYMSDWLSFHGVVARRFIGQFTILAAVGAIAFRTATGRQWMPALAALVSAAGVALAMGAEVWCIPSRCDFLEIASPHLRANFLYGSRWLTTHVDAAHVAYAGINLPYPLSGSHLSNVVSYVNIDRHADWRFHDYARDFRIGRLSEDVPALARASGLLISATSSATMVDALRPRFERRQGNRDAWVANVRGRHIDYVFVSTLDPYEIDYVWHNAARFPIEDEWARGDPSAFRLVYENPDVRIYEVTAS